MDDQKVGPLRELSCSFGLPFLEKAIGTAPLDEAVGHWVRKFVPMIVFGNCKKYTSGSGGVAAWHYVTVQSTLFF